MLVYASRAKNGGQRGGIAQLGERLNGIQKVGGSNPPTSTITRKSEDFLDEKVLFSYLGAVCRFSKHHREQILRGVAMTDITLVTLDPHDRERFILDNQEAFNYGALEEFGRRDDHFEKEGEIISRETIEASIDGGEAYRIMQDGQPVGGVVIRVNGERGDLELLFVSPRVHSKGIGYAAWCAVERLHPEVTVWETVTPYFEKRNIHFYVNRCGFHIVEFFNSHHPDPKESEDKQETDEQFPDGMFRFEKII